VLWGDCACKPDTHHSTSSCVMFVRWCTGSTKTLNLGKLVKLCLCMCVYVCTSVHDVEQYFEVHAMAWNVSGSIHGHFQTIVSSR